MMTTERARIVGREAATAFCDDLTNLIEAMIATLDAETDHIRSARYDEAAQLTEAKSHLTARYVAALDTLKEDRHEIGRHAPGGIDRLRQLQHGFEKSLESNMTVLTTARTVSETLIRSLGEEAIKRQAPTTYGQDARTHVARPQSAAIGVNVAT